MTVELAPAAPEMLGLATREGEILELMAAGLSNRGIAARLCVSAKTIEHYVARIFTKLAIAETPESNRRVQAVLLYLAAVEIAQRIA